MMEKSEHKVQSVRLRAVLIGFISAMAICAVTPFNNAYRMATPLGGGHFPLAPFYILIWMTILMGIARTFFKKYSILTGRELLTAWAMMVLGSGIAYTGLVRTFFINLTAPFHFATVENRWGDVLLPRLPRKLYPQDGKAIENLYNGISGGKQMNWWEIIGNIPWDAWLVPFLIWGGFILLCYGVMICIINILSRQAIAHERMNFPLLQVPKMMEEALDNNRLLRFFSNRFLLAGMTIPVTLHLINGLNFYYPGIPQIPTLVLAGPYFPETGLFSGFTKLKIYIYPAFIAFGFLVSKQISFAFWFFYLLGKLLFGLFGLIGYNIPPAALGVTFGPTLSYPEETQMIGAFFVFFLFLLWIGRHRLKQVIAHAFYLRSSYDFNPQQEWFSTRIAVFGVIGGSLLLLFWFYYFGMPYNAAVTVLVVFFIFTLVATRVICQGGVAYFTLTAAPIDGILAFLGPQFFTKVGLILAVVTQKVLFLDLREALMPSLLHTRKIEERQNRRRMILAAVFITLVCAVLVSFVSMLALAYKFGLRDLGLDWATGSTVTMYENLFSLVDSPVQSGHWVKIFTSVGAAVMLILVICYHRFYWWPLHPLGYLTTYSSAMQILWFSFFVGWICNALCMRYGGVVLFKKIRYFFIGLIIGDFFMGGTFAVIGLFSFASYQVLPT
jgi:hypothetical protein